MKNKMIIGIAFVVVALALIAVGSMGLLNNGKVNKDGKTDEKKEVSYASETANRNYQVASTMAKDSTATFDVEAIKKTSESIGFKGTICDDSYCMASNSAYKDDDMYQDGFSVIFDKDNSFNNMTTMIYYSEKDFSYDTLYKDVNALVGSYVGLEISKENLEKIKKPSNSEEVNENNYIDSKFTIQMSLQYVEKKGLYVYRSFIIETAKFK